MIEILNRYTRAVLFGSATAQDIASALTEAVSQKADLRWATLSEANLYRANLYGANLSGANLYGANLRWANLSEANLSEANLYRANLYRANLYGANLSEANLSEADLYRANLYGANLYGANLSEANLSGANLSEADLPEEWKKFAIPRLSKRVAEIVLANPDTALEMGNWHTCETTHCLAGWAVHLAGPAGYALESAVGPEVAGIMLMPDARHLFHASNDEALAWLREQVK